LLSGESVPSPTTPQAPEPVVHNITFYRDGFTVGDGPLRRIEDPENGPFLEVCVYLCWGK
jgi:UBX domain-containing protein 1